MNKITVPAKIENLQNVLDFVIKELDSVEYNIKALLQLELSIEEAYVNIANYAYESEDGEVLICCNINKNPLQITVQFIDCGIPYNPLKNENSDISLEIKEKKVGGLGILLIKKNVDNIAYEYKDGKNILTIQKKLNS
ncbi:MAG: ATP-binding protein [Methanobacterium sp.]|uniref:ATP-binding protein n=1 Tax=Methanobacterium sp. TaxID=2164 RepID=UPI003D64BAA2|nr:ATP-binding protein [Methanobacterium sp.]